MGKDVIKKYYQGIMDQIQIEVDLINSNFNHNGLKGEGNENIIKEIIKKSIPAKYGVDTGIVIDKDGNQSKQCDIIIYDKFSHPQLLGLSSVKMFPVDIVYAVIEVKTTLDKTAAIKSIENINSVWNLNYITEAFRAFPTDPIEKITKDTTIFENHFTTPPIGIVFGYSSKTMNNSTFKKWFGSKENFGKEHLPPIICCLDQGILIKKSNDYVSLLFPAIEDDSIAFIKDDKIIVREKKLCIYNDKIYRFMQVGKEKMLINESKILLNFIFTLCENLDKKKISPNLNFRMNYLSEEDQLIFVNHNDEIKIAHHK
jgi:hypothetical protein